MRRRPATASATLSPPFAASCPPAASSATAALSPSIPSRWTFDVAAFEQCAARGTLDALAQAADLYRGDLLEGLGAREAPFEEWLLTERERLRELAVEALARLLAHESKAGSTQRAIQIATRLLALDPLQEVVHRALMRLYARQGRRSAALKQYQVCVEVLKRELGAAPERETRQLYETLMERRATGALAELDVTSAAPPRESVPSRAAPTPAPRPDARHERAAPRPAAPGPPEGERKHITVLFADLCGSTEVVLDRDPEEARQVSTPCSNG